MNGTITIQLENAFKKILAQVESSLVEYMQKTNASIDDLSKNEEAGFTEIIDIRTGEKVIF